MVGIEVPNEKRDTVGIKEVLEDTEFTRHKSKLAIAVGKDINGDFIVGDLAKMPHLLIAGQTGSPQLSIPQIRHSMHSSGESQRWKDAIAHSSH